MVTTTPRQKAERCFAVARSTTHEGERANAISLGLSICKREDLDPDTFDIPGRQRRINPGAADALRYGMDARGWSRSAPPTQQGFDFAHRPTDKAPEFYSASDVAEAMARFNAANRAAAEAMRQSRMREAAEDFMAKAADAGSGFAAAFEAGAKARYEREAERRRQQRARWPTPKDAIDFLFSRGVSVYDLGDPAAIDDDDGRWYVPSRMSSPRYTDDGVRDLADEIAGT